MISAFWDQKIYPDFVESYNLDNAHMEKFVPMKDDVTLTFSFDEAKIGHVLKQMGKAGMEWCSLSTYFCFMFLFTSL